MNRTGKVARWWVPAYFAAAAVAGLTGHRYLLATLVTLHLYLLFVLSWDLFCGPARETNFGHTFFIGGGGYLSAWLQAEKDLSPWLCLALAVLAATGVGMALGWLAHRARGPVFALLTMAFQLMLYQAVFLFPGVFGGEEGIHEVAPLLTSPAGRFYLVLAAAAGFAGLRAYLLRSRPGLLLQAVGQDETLARSSGVQALRLRVTVFALSAGGGALAGALYVHTQGQINAEMVGSALAVQIVLLALVGGGASGPLLCVLAFFLLQRLMAGVVPMASGVYAVVLFVALLLFPQGLVPRAPGRTR